MSFFNKKTIFSKNVAYDCFLFSRRIFEIINYQLSNTRVNILELFMPTFTRNFSQGILTGNFLLQGCFCSIFNGLTSFLEEKLR